MCQQCNQDLCSHILAWLLVIVKYQELDQLYISISCLVSSIINSSIACMHAPGVPAATAADPMLTILHSTRIVSIMRSTKEIKHVASRPHIVLQGPGDMHVPDTVNAKWETTRHCSTPGAGTYSTDDTTRLSCNSYETF